MIKKKIVLKLRQEVKVEVDIVTTDDIKIYYTGKFQDFSAMYIIMRYNSFFTIQSQVLTFLKEEAFENIVGGKKYWFQYFLLFLQGF